MVNNSVNEFYTWFLFKIDTLPQEILLLLDISVNFFNKLIPDVWEFLISEGFQVLQRLYTETNLRINQMLILIINAEV